MRKEQKEDLKLKSTCNYVGLLAYKSSGLSLVFPIRIKSNNKVLEGLGFAQAHPVKFFTGESLKNYERHTSSKCYPRI